MHISRSIRKRLDRGRLPAPADFYAYQLERFKPGQRFASACCPFHDDRHPSFVVNLTTGRFECKACGANGSDIIAFLMQRDGVDFRAAVDQLGAWSN